MQHEFYLITSPDLVDESINELQDILPFCRNNSGRPFVLDEVRIEKGLGGIHFFAPLELGLQLNVLAKTLTRVLLRVAQFQCREFYQLEKEIRKIKLDFLNITGSPISLKVAASKSKLGQEKRIQETVEKAWKGLFQFDESSNLSVYIRIENDLVTISFDTSGDFLYQRGVLKHRGPAPLRETLGAQMIRWMIADSTAEERASLTWLDPMAGSGTLPSEIVGYSLPTQGRQYSFQKMKSLPLAVQSVLTSPGPKDQRIYSRVIAADVSNEAVEMMNSNFKKNLHLEKKSSTSFVDASFEKIEVLRQNFLNIQSRKDFNISDSERLFILMNPPYGERIDLQRADSASQPNSGQAPSSRPWEDFLQIACGLNADRVGFLFSEKGLDVSKKNPNFKIPDSLAESYQIHSQHFFRNGGMPVVFTVLERR